jgi:hypothetical protein
LLDSFEKESNVRYPTIKVDLGNLEGNAFAIIDKCRGALRKAGVPEDEIDAFVVTATASNYDNLLCVVLETVDAKLGWNGE